MAYKPGEKAPHAGSYKVSDTKGKVVNTVQMNKGDSFPPTQHSSYTYSE